MGGDAPGGDEAIERGEQGGGMAAAVERPHMRDDPIGPRLDGSGRDFIRGIVAIPDDMDFLLPRAGRRRKRFQEGTARQQEHRALPAPRRLDSWTRGG